MGSTTPTDAAAPKPEKRLSTWAQFLDSDMLASFLSLAGHDVVAALVTVVMLVGALLAPWIAPTNPFDPASVDLIEFAALRRAGSRAAIRASCSAPTIRDATCSPPSSTARACR